jgi:hypothetical protein
MLAAPRLDLDHRDDVGRRRVSLRGGLVTQRVLSTG